MSHAPHHAAARASRAAASWRPRAIVALLGILGIGVLLYPSASQWNSARIQANTVFSYAGAVQELPAAGRIEMLDAAHAYNATLTGTPPPDPYTTNPPPDEAMLAELDKYFSLLAVEETMGRLRIPSIDVDLPIFHGTSEYALDRGVGHLFGTALPVGGPSTHSVLTAHRGIPEARFFNRLPEVRVGDDVVIDVLGEHVVYRVVSTEVVLPTETDSLSMVPGEDLMTLITCTPYAVNSHRLLVHTERVEDEDSVTAALGDADSVHSIPFPWWMFGAAITVLGAGGFVLIPIWRQRRTQPGEAVA